MTKAKAINILDLYQPGHCAVRWSRRFRRPAWTIETIDFAEKMIAEHGSDYCRIEERATEQANN